MRSKESWARHLVSAAAIACLLGSPSARAASLNDSVQLITAAGAAAAPAQKTFTVSQVGSYTLTLTDLQQPAALASLSATIASSTANVVVLSVNEAATATSVSQTVTLQPGTYAVQLLATAAAGQPGGAFEVQVTAGGASVTGFPYDNVVSAASAPPSTGQSALTTQFTVTSAGTYQLSVTDLAFPAALNSLQLIVLNHCASAPCAIAPVAPPSTLSGSSLSSSLNLSRGTYDLFVVAEADAAALKGLYSLQIVGGSATVYAAVVPVGQLTVSASFSLNATSAVSLQLADLSTPAALSGLTALVTQGSTVVKSYASAGTQTFTAAPSSVFGPVQVYVAAQPGTGGQGAYDIYALSGSTVLAEVAQPVLAAGSVGYAFQPQTVPTAGNYQIGVYDFTLPQPFNSLNAAAVQAGAVLATTSSGSGIFAVAATPVTLLVFPTLTSVNAQGLFGVELIQVASNAAPAFATTQGVGAQFSSQSVTVSSAGLYDLTLTDLGFPEDLSAASVIITHGYSSPGTAFPSGTTALNLTPGTYLLNVLAQPGAGASYGLYGLRLSEAPTVTLAATPTSVSSGASVALTWNSANATACAATANPVLSGWNGALPTSAGTVSSGSLTATTTFSISCSDANGNSASATASVAVTPVTPNSKGGGGAITTPTLLELMLFGLWQVRRRQRWVP